MLIEFLVYEGELRSFPGWLVNYGPANILQSVIKFYNATTLCTGTDTGSRTFIFVISVLYASRRFINTYTRIQVFTAVHRAFLGYDMVHKLL